MENPVRTLAAFLWHFISKQKSSFIVLLTCQLAWSLDQTIMPYIFSLFLSKITAFSGDKATAWSVLAGPVAMGAGLWIMAEVMYRSYDFLSSRFYPRFEAAIRLEMVEYVQGHSFQYFADHFAGNIANKINDMPDSATQIVQLWIQTFIPTIVAMLIGSALFASMHPSFALLMLSWFVIHIGMCLVMARQCNHYSDLHSASKSTLMGKIVDSFTNIISIQTFANRQWESAHTHSYQQDEQQKQQRMLMLIFKIRFAQGSFSFLMIGVVATWLMIYQWQHNVLTAAEVVYIFYTSWGLTMMAWMSGTQLPQFFKHMGTCQQAFAVMQAPHDIVDSHDAVPLRVTKGEIQFNHVTFRYRSRKTLFKNKQLILQAGEKVGLVGFSGSGKTTFVHLILRFFDIESGNIMIDGQDIRHVTLESLREQISMIPQYPTLFHRSLIENIRYGNINATDEQVIEAAQRAHCHEFISQLSDGYQTLVGERGVKLSGGQRQRIAIARALLKDAPIVILDEATSSLDSVTEKYIQTGLRTLMAGRTTIVIAHRLSTLSEMDRILVFDNGRIIEDGAHEQLLANNGRYAHMWRMQAGGFLPERDSLQTARPSP